LRLRDILYTARSQTSWGLLVLNPFYFFFLKLLPVLTYVFRCIYDHFMTLKILRVFFESLNLIELAASEHNCGFQIHAVYSGQRVQILNNPLEFYYALQ